VKIAVVSGVQHADTVERIAQQLEGDAVDVFERDDEASVGREEVDDLDEVRMRQARVARDLVGDLERQQPLVTFGRAEHLEHHLTFGPVGREKGLARPGKRLTTPGASRATGRRHGPSSPGSRREAHPSSLN